MSGYQPDGAALGNLHAMLAAVVNKPGGISIVTKEIRMLRFASAIFLNFLDVALKIPNLADLDIGVLQRLPVDEQEADPNMRYSGNVALGTREAVANNGGIVAQGRALLGFVASAPIVIRPAAWWCSAGDRATGLPRSHRIWLWFY